MRKNTGVLKNGIWLFVLQVFNMALPLVTLPYVTRVLGSDGYGVFSLALNWVTYSQVLVEYGFNLNGARQVALSKTQSDLQQTYNGIVWARIVLLFISGLILGAACIASGVNALFAFSLGALFLVPCSVALQQTWLFQGKQDMHLITIVTVISKVISVGLIFLFVTQADDEPTYCFMYSLAFLIASLLSVFVVYRKYGLRIGKFNLSNAKNQLHEGWNLFLSSAISQVFSGFGVTVLGIFATTEVVGVYSAIYKLPMVILMLFAPIGQAIYPKVSQLHAKSRKEGLRFIAKVALPTQCVILGVILVICLFRFPLVGIIFGEEYVSSANIIIPLAIWMFFSILNNFLGIQGLIAAGYEKTYLKSFTASMLIAVVLDFALIPTLGMYGVGIATLLAECVLSALLFFTIKRISN